MAKEIAEGIGKKLREMLTKCIEKLETRAAKYVSGGSADESSGLKDEEVDIKMDYAESHSDW